MKPAPFAYDRPQSLDEALALLAEHGEDAKVLAGGQSLVPLLNFRLARPARLIDVNRVPGLSYLRRERGTLRIGALTRQATLERSRLVAEHWRLLLDAVVHVGHPQTRNRGTVGGSVVHADPSAELPVALAALDARFHVQSRRGRRALDAAELFVTQLTTSISPDELLVEIEVPPLPKGAKVGFAELSLTHGDFALAGAAVVLAPDRASVALLGAGAVPIRAFEAERALGEGASGREAGELAARAVEVDDDYRRSLVAALVRSAVEGAA